MVVIIYLTHCWKLRYSPIVKKSLLFLAYLRCFFYYYYYYSKTRIRLAPCMRNFFKKWLHRKGLCDRSLFDFWIISVHWCWFCLSLFTFYVLLVLLFNRIVNCCTVSIQLASYFYWICQILYLIYMLFSFFIYLSLFVCIVVVVLHVRALIFFSLLQFQLLADIFWNIYTVLPIRLFTSTTY